MKKLMGLAVAIAFFALFTQATVSKQAIFNPPEPVGISIANM
jgi:hypothetical protein